MRTILEEDLRAAVAASLTISETVRKLGLGRGHNFCKRVKRLISEYSIDASHFSISEVRAKRRLYERIEKNCPECGAAFVERKGHPKEKTYCSRKCANKNIPEDVLVKRAQAVLASIPTRKIAVRVVKVTDIKKPARKKRMAAIKPPPPPREKLPYSKPTITSRLLFPQPKRSPCGRIKYTRELLEPVVKISDTYAEVLEVLGVCNKGGNVTTVKRHILRFGLSTDHFGKGRREHLRRIGAAKRRPDSEIFCQGGAAAQTMIRKRFAKLSPPLECAVCGLKDWLGSPISFDLDHINGDNFDNRIENLRWLCPNCHRQTPTFGSKRGLPTLRRTYSCIDCGTKIASKSSRCRLCHLKFIKPEKQFTPT